MGFFLIDFIKNNFGAPPNSTLFILGVSLVISVVYALAQVYLVDQHKIRVYNQKIKKWDEKRRKALATGNPRLLSEVQREKEIIERMKTEISSEQMRPLMFFFIPFFLVFLLLTNAYGTSPVAILPFRMPITWFGGYIGNKTGLTAVWWYFFVNLTFSSYLNTILKLLGMRKY
ncbi:MAG: EMC3/TMCO1 family protein [Candidatus Njordarchaeia archaeon]